MSAASLRSCVAEGPMLDVCFVAAGGGGSRRRPRSWEPLRSCSVDGASQWCLLRSSWGMALSCLSADAPPVGMSLGGVCVHTQGSLLGDGNPSGRLDSGVGPWEALRQPA